MTDPLLLGQFLPARQRSQYALINLAFSVVGMVLGVRSDVRNPRRLTVLAIANEALTTWTCVPRVARAVQRRLNPSGNSRPAAATAIRGERETVRTRRGGWRCAPGGCMR